MEIRIKSLMITKLVHVIVGTIFILVGFFRIVNYHLSTKHHLGLKRVFYTGTLWMLCGYFFSLQFTTGVVINLLSAILLSFFVLKFLYNYLLLATSKDKGKGKGKGKEKEPRSPTLMSTPGMSTEAIKRIDMEGVSDNSTSVVEKEGRSAP